MRYLPVNLDLKDQPVLVLGAGNTASRKINKLLSVNAEVTCLALKFNQEILRLKQQGLIKTVKQDLQENLDLSTYKHVRTIISATGVPSIDEAVYEFAQKNNLWVNTVDNQALCDFITPAIVDRSPVVVSISTEGSAPVLARIIKQKIEYLLPQKLAQLATQAASLRKRIKAAIPEFNQRKNFWTRYFNWSHRSTSIEADTTSANNEEHIIHLIQQTNNQAGHVSLVGAGPGNPDLLTLGAIKALQNADVVLHDQLISSEIMALIRTDAERIDVGKKAGNHQTKQQHINELMIQLARKNLKVCRLKGGDSFVFGRGGEEAMALKKAGVAFEIIPGITAALGCAAYAGIPLTHRDHAQSLALMTAHCSDSRDSIDWQFYAKDNQTLAVYMGLIQSRHLTQSLIAHGKSPQEPIAIIENGSTNKQRTITGELLQLPEMIDKHEVKSPALIVIGKVAQYATELDWFKSHINHQTTHAIQTFKKTA